MHEAVALLTAMTLTTFDLQGHRGARGHLPENTLPSFERAIRPASSSTRRCFMKPGSDMS